MLKSGEWVLCLVVGGSALKGDGVGCAFRLGFVGERKNELHGEETDIQVLHDQVEPVKLPSSGQQDPRTRMKNDVRKLHTLPTR